ncbi:MAG: glycosyltransferase family 2 protein [Patescibacteria group bacterium]|nr:glycosyltransferase family 2 protein [Patescibacteria group bacterium]
MEKNFNKIVVVIPAYNEEKNIEKVINEVKPLVNELVIVDDGSSDKTFELAKKQGVTVLRHLINRGQGAALQTGDEYALNNQADIVVHFDADGQFLSSEIKEIILPIQNGEADAVFGSRFLGKKSEIPWFKEKIIIPLAGLVNKILINISLTDPQNGFRALSRKALEKITIENDGMAHCSEILYKVSKNKLTIKEVPITVIYHDFGQGIFRGNGRGTGGLRIIKDLFLARLMK